MPYSPETSISYAFGKAWAGALKEIATLEQESRQQGETAPLVGDRKAILGAYRKSESFKHLYSQTRQSLLVPKSPSEIEKIKTDFAGKSYEDIAYRYLLGKIKKATLLSPSNTLKFFSTLHPTTPVLKRGLNTSFLKHTWVPDGLIVNKNNDAKILSVCEYTLSGKSGYFKYKTQTLKKTRENFSGIFSSADFLFVLPKNTQLSEGVEKRIHTISLVFTHKEFSHFVNSTFSNFRQERESATLMEIQKRIKEQPKRVITTAPGINE